MKESDKFPTTTVTSDGIHPEDVLLCSVCDDNFLPGALVMLASMADHIPDFHRYPIRIFCDNVISELSDSSRQLIRQVAPRVEFVEVDQPVYREDEIKHEHHRQAFVTLEVFRQAGFRKVCFFDMDMLCIGDFSSVFKLDAPFAACQEGAKGPWIDYEGLDPWSPAVTVNTGFFVLDGDLCSASQYEKLMGFIRQQSRKHRLLLDQDILNRYLRNTGIHIYRLPETYNFRRWGGVVLNGEKFPTLGNNDVFKANLSRIRIIHYSHYHRRPKPWQAADNDENLATRLWQERYDRLKKTIPDIC